MFFFSLTKSTFFLISLLLFLLTLFTSCSEDKSPTGPTTLQLQIAKLLAGDAKKGDNLGYSVAIDGETAIIGAHQNDGRHSESGSAYIFTRSGTSWSQQAKLTAGNDAWRKDHFGVSVGIDGDTVIVGAHQNDDGGADSGSAYIFTRSGATWTKQTKLTAGDAKKGDRFGVSVSIDGDTVIIGAIGNDDGGNASGSAYVFTGSGATWSQQTNLVAGDAAAKDRFGRSVGIDGDTAIVGAYLDDNGGADSGSAYVFTRSVSTWTEETNLVASDAAVTNNFGYSVGIDGETVIIGAHQNDDGGTDSGSAYIFTRSGTTWTEQTKLTASDAGANDNFGYSVGIAGERAIIGAYLNDDGGDNSGSAYTFTRSGTTWTEQTKLTASDAGANDNFGYSVAIDGDTAIVGAHQNDAGGTNSGFAYVISGL